MEIVQTRTTRTEKSTISVVTIDGNHECFILEDVDRGLLQTMPVSEILEKKVFGKTAIPTGRYEIKITYSDHFKKDLPLLLNVPGYEGVRIHSGNTAEDTEGCLLPGTDHDTDLVLNSRVAFVPLFDKIKAALATAKVFITIQ